MRRLGSLFSMVVIALASSACSSGDGEGDGTRTTVPRSTSTTIRATSTTSPEDAYAVPATIDADYVNRVMAALNKVYGDVVRQQVERQAFVAEDLVPIRAIYGENETYQTGQAFATPIGPRDNYQDPIGDRIVSVEELISATASCIFFRGTFDYSAVSRRAAAPDPGWVHLARKDPAQDPLNLNPTPWIIEMEEFDEQADPCA